MEKNQVDATLVIVHTVIIHCAVPYVGAWEDVSMYDLPLADLAWR